MEDLKAVLQFVQEDFEKLHKGFFSFFVKKKKKKKKKKLSFRS